MNQLAMIAKGGESTVLSVADDGREDLTSETVNPQRCDKSEIQSAFCKLTTAELLKHLLSARVNSRSGCDKSNGGDETKKKRRYDSSQEAEVKMCGDATDHPMIKRTFCSKLSSDICEVAGDKVNDNYLSCETGRDYTLPQFVDVQHGRMDKQCDEQTSENAHIHLFTNEVQFRENLQRNVSVESSQSEQLSDEEISSLSKSILESNALDFILSVTEKKLCIQSPSQNESTSDYSINSEFSEFTELLPLIGNPTDFSAEAFSPGVSITAVSSGNVSTPEAESSENNDRSNEAKSCGDTDQDVENAMVLVPSGNPHHHGIVVSINQRDRMVGGPQEQDIVVPIIQRDRISGRPQQQETVVPHYQNKKLSQHPHASALVIKGPHELVIPNYQSIRFIGGSQAPKTIIPVYEDSNIFVGSLHDASAEKQRQRTTIPGNRKSAAYQQENKLNNKKNISSDARKQEELIAGKDHNDKIVGGQGANIADYPYQLSLVLWRRFHFCGAVLIATKWALTAAHCTYGKFPFDLFVRAGSSTYKSGGQVVPVAQIIEHESYFRTSADYDISILELNEDVITKDAKPIELITTKPKAGDEATVSGWGRTTRDDRRPPSILQVVKLPVIDHKVCTDIYGKTKSSKWSITDRMFCAGLLEYGGKGACLGDSGGPITVGGKLAGLVSWGRSCAVAGYPGVYASIADLKGWIEENIKQYTY